MISQNEIHDNSNSAMLIYRNCGEYSTVNRRWCGADANQIVDNVIVSERNGVWIASRQAENQWFMECADPAYIDQPLRRVHLDHAVGNVVARNWFVQVRSGVRVEDDRQPHRGQHLRRRPRRLPGGRRRHPDPDAGPRATGDRHHRARQPVEDRRHPLPLRVGLGADRHHRRRQHQQRLARHARRGRPTPTDPFLFVIRVWL